MKGDPAISIKFLKDMQPKGPWCVTSITTDRKSIKTDTFFPGQEKELKDWIDKYNGQRNIYFHINEVIGSLTKKAEREDIQRVPFLHVDVDPRPGEDIAEERERALKLLTTPPDGIPKPNCVIFSGGGYQAFWRLEEPIEIGGDLGLAEDAKRYNMTLERVFSADNCHNIDRLCRLPGTLNIPDAKKLKKGRQIELSTVTWLDDGAYPLTSFKPAQIVQIAADKGFGGGTVKVPGNIKRLDSVDALDEWNVPNRVRVIIVQGRDPDTPKEGDNSRSAWLFDCLCNLFRCSVPDEVVYSIITDPDNGIAESVIDKGSAAEKYAVRQMERAKEYAIDPHLHELNQKHAVIADIGGKCRVIQEVFDPALGRSRISRQSFDDFRNRYMHIQIKIGTNKDGADILKPLGAWWLNHRQRRQFESMVFSPGREVEGAYNMWKGFACESVPGNKHEPFLEHIKINICGGVEEHYTYLIGWLANMMQNLDSPGHTAIVMRGKRGTGKSFFVKQVGNLLGRHYLMVADSKHLIGSFNSHLRDCILLFGDEAFYAGDKKHESVLKTLITEEMISIEAKGIDVEASPNYTHVMLASNNDWVVPAGTDERRFFVLDVGEGSKQDAAYFRDIARLMDGGGRENLLNFLLNYDLSNYEIRKVPQTSALQDQKILSMDPVQEWWYNKLHDGRILSEDDNWRDEIIKDVLFDDYVEQMRRYNVQRRHSKTVLGKFLMDCCPAMKSFQKNMKVKVTTHDGYTTDKERRPYVYSIPSLEICRQQWEEKYGTGSTWPIIEASQPSFQEKSPEVPF